MVEREQANMAERLLLSATVVSEWAVAPRSPSSVANGELKSRFLHGLQQRERDLIVGEGSYREFLNTAVVSHQGDRAEHLYLLIKGSARYFFITPKGQQVYLLWLKAGDVFGLASLLCEPAPFLVSTEILKHSQVLAWRRGTIRSLAERYPKLLTNCLSIANEYLTWYLATHLSLISHTAPQRLAHVLISLATGIGQKCGSGVLLDTTNEQLANTANITLFTASRLLSQWRRSGAIAKTRGKIVLLHPELLFASGRSARLPRANAVQKT
jgi:CRP/FNR family transcriptional regulator, anaerobic regulatory protein